MKNSILVILAVLNILPSAFAYDGQNNFAGKDAALVACGKISSDYSRMDCIKAVQKANFIDKDVVTLCDSTKSAFSTTDCLTKVSNKLFLAESVKVCMRISSDYDKIECAEAIAGKSYSNAMLNTCDKMASAYSTIDCLKQGSNGSLQQPRRSGECSEETYLKAVRGALGNFRGRNMEAVENTLENLQKRLERCSL